MPPHLSTSPRPEFGQTSGYSTNIRARLGEPQDGKTHAWELGWLRRRPPSLTRSMDKVVAGRAPRTNRNRDQHEPNYRPPTNPPLGSDHVWTVSCAAALCAPHRMCAHTHRPIPFPSSPNSAKAHRKCLPEKEGGNWHAPNIAQKRCHNVSPTHAADNTSGGSVRASM